MNELHNLQQLATTPIREDGTVRDGSVQARAALEILFATSCMWKIQPCNAGCGGCKGDLAEKGVNHEL